MFVHVIQHKQLLARQQSLGVGATGQRGGRNWAWKRHVQLKRLFSGSSPVPPGVHPLKDVHGNYKKQKTVVLKSNRHHHFNNPGNHNGHHNGSGMNNPNNPYMMYNNPNDPHQRQQYNSSNLHEYQAQFKAQHALVTIIIIIALITLFIYILLYILHLIYISPYESSLYLEFDINYYIIYVCMCIFV